MSFGMSFWPGTLVAGMGAGGAEQPSVSAQWQSTLKPDPPLNDTIANGQFESGDLSGWNATGEVTPIMTTTAHTGLYGA
jgi:hypothetical protein